MEIKICEFCGNEFIPNNGKQKCCSRNCQVKLWRKNNPDKAKKSEIKQNEKRKEERRKGIKRYNSEVRKKWYSNKKNDNEWMDKKRLQEKNRNDKVKEFVRRYKILVGCKDCGYKTNPVALDFDHITDNKLINVSNAKSIKQAKEEIRKCEVVCANCHRIRTYNRLHKGD